MKIYKKDFRVLSDLVGKKIYVYNGKEFQRKTVHAGMVGHKLGEFLWTKKFGPRIHVKEGKKKKRKGKK